MCAFSPFLHIFAWKFSQKFLETWLCCKTFHEISARGEKCSGKQIFLRKSSKISCHSIFFQKFSLCSTYCKFKFFVINLRKSQKCSFSRIFFHLRIVLQAIFAKMWKCENENLRFCLILGPFTVCAREVWEAEEAGSWMWEGPECERAQNVGGHWMWEGPECGRAVSGDWRGAISNDYMTGYLVWPGEDCRLHSVIGSYSAGNSCLKLKFF
jgi:hypothetical protein